MHITIVGAGPAGSATAFHLARKGHDVHVYERNAQIGPPVQCTGILSDYFTALLKPSDAFVLNTVTRTRIHVPDGSYLEAPIKKNYVVCRKKFDTYLADMAKKAGANFHLNHSFQSFQNGYAHFKTEETISVQTDVLVGADGPLSPVAKSADLFKGRNHLIGTQIEARMPHDNVVDFFPHIGSYAWIVPVNDTDVRLGVAAYKSPVKLFKKLAGEYIGDDFDQKTLENQSGVIPLFNPRVRAQKDSVYLIGDAATFNKATSGGGINQALKTAKILADCIHTGRDYQKAWRNALYRNLHTHLIVHKIMQKFTDDDWNHLIRTFSETKMKKILYEQSRDRIVPMVLRIALNKPSLIKYVKYLPREEIKNI